MKRCVLISALFLSVIHLTKAQNFTGSFKLLMIQKYKNGDTRTDTISYYFKDELSALIICGRRNQPEMRMVFNKVDSTITNLFVVNNQKQGYILPMDETYWPGLPESMAAASQKAEKISYTGEEKTIEGYDCLQVQPENSEYEVNLWATDEIPLTMTQVLSYQSVGKGKSKKEISLFKELGVSGLPLEMTLKSKLGKADVEVRIIDISHEFDDAIFSTDDFTLTRID